MDSLARLVAPTLTLGLLAGFWFLFPGLGLWRVPVLLLYLAAAIMSLLVMAAGARAGKRAWPGWAMLLPAPSLALLAIILLYVGIGP